MNKIFLVGRLGDDPVTRQAGDANVTTFSLAENQQRRRDGEEPKTNWYRCSVWRGLGDTCAKYLHKGDAVSLVGTLAVREYTGKDGQTRTSLDVTVSDVEFHSNRRSEAGETNAPVGKARPSDPIVDDGDELPF